MLDRYYVDLILQEFLRSFTCSAVEKCVEVVEVLQMQGFTINGSRLALHVVNKMLQSVYENENFVAKNKWQKAITEIEKLKTYKIDNK